MYGNPTHLHRKPAGHWRARILMLLALTLAAIVISGDAVGAAGKSWTEPPGRIILAETRDECIMRCVANRDLCQRSCSTQFDQCIAGGGDDGSCGEIFRACHADCGEVGFNRCVTEQCYTLPN